MNEREKFESWAKNNDFDIGKYSNGYNAISTRAAWEAWQAALSTRKVYGFGVISKTEPQRLVYETQRSAEMESSYLNKHCKEGSPFRPVELFYEDSES